MSPDKSEEPYNRVRRYPDCFSGDRQLFGQIISQRNTAIVWDIDGVLAHTARPVCSRTFITHKLLGHPSAINNWEYLTDLAVKNNKTEEEICDIKNGWYLPEVLSKAPRNLFMGKVVELTTSYYGPGNNHVLTARKPNLATITNTWLRLNFPQIISDNIYIRENLDEEEAGFKARNIKRLALSAPSVVLIDDSVSYVEEVLKMNLENVYVINTPMGVITPPQEWQGNKHLFVLKRHPHILQSMYPLYYVYYELKSVISK